MKRNILIGVSIAMLLIALAVTIVSNGTYSTNTVGISCGEVSDTEKASILYNDNQIFFHTPRLKETVKENEIDDMEIKNEIDQKVYDRNDILKKDAEKDMDLRRK